MDISRMTEQQIQSKIIKYLKAQGAYVVKVVSATRAGVPDLIACYRGKFIGIEVKRPEKKTNVSELQKYNLKAIKEAGGIAIVAWELNQVKELLNES